MCQEWTWRERHQINNWNKLSPIDHTKIGRIHSRFEFDMDSQLRIKGTSKDP